ncbi:hypothetical protein [Chitiniphilus eburneus]|uniref:hypothetical protein n=1 Tax=Chitiniphilus eburneus TaxID=2571148 RepID=UPI0035CE9424
MADSTPNLQQMTSTQANKEALFNSLFGAVSPSAMYGQNVLASSGLTWAYYGGRWNGAAVANGTVTLTASTTNYIVANRSTGAVSIATTTTNWNDTTNYLRLYQVTTNTTAPTATGIQDVRPTPGMGGGGGPANTDALPEGSTNLYFTTARVRATDLAGLSTATATAVTSSDTILSGMGKLQAQVSAVALTNRIMNGDMAIAQRGSSFAAVANGQYTLDRWRVGVSTTGVVTIAQVADAPGDNEFQYSQRMTVTTADTSIAAGEFLGIQQFIEGYNVRDLAGRDFTLSFRVRSSKTGVHCVSFGNTGADRSFIAEYTVTAANTWETKTLTVPGGLITAGTWDWTNGRGLYVGFTLACGSSLQTTPNAWQTGNYVGTANQVNCLDTIGNIFAITGVDLKPGANATAFQHVNYATALQECFRYTRPFPMSPGMAYSTSAATFRCDIGTPMRATPSATAGTYQAITATGSNAAGTLGAMNLTQGVTVTFDLTAVAGSPLVAGNATFIVPPAGALLTAEL